jgi:hypothetical protein
MPTLACAPYWLAGGAAIRLPMNDLGEQRLVSVKGLLQQRPKRLVKLCDEPRPGLARVT